MIARHGIALPNDMEDLRRQLAKVAVIGDPGPQQFLEVHMPACEDVDWHGPFETDNSILSPGSCIDWNVHSASNAIQKPPDFPRRDTGSPHPPTVSEMGGNEGIFAAASKVTNNERPPCSSASDARKLSALNHVQVGVEFVLS